MGQLYTTEDSAAPCSCAAGSTGPESPAQPLDASPGRGGWVSSDCVTSALGAASPSSDAADLSGNVAGTSRLAQAASARPSIAAGNIIRRARCTLSSRRSAGSAVHSTPQPRAVRPLRTRMGLSRPAVFSASKPRAPANAPRKPRSGQPGPVSPLTGRRRRELTAAGRSCRPHATDHSVVSRSALRRLGVSSDFFTRRSPGSGVRVIRRSASAGACHQ